MHDLVEAFIRWGSNIFSASDREAGPKSRARAQSAGALPQQPYAALPAKRFLQIRDDERGRSRLEPPTECSVSRLVPNIGKDGPLRMCFHWC